MRIVILATFASMLAAAPVLANSLVAPGPRAGIAKSRLSASPAGEWNRLSRSEGKYVETWTLDGDALNKVNFFGGVATGQPLLRQANKNRPLPKVAGNMLITDIPVLLERSARWSTASSISSPMRRRRSISSPRISRSFGRWRHR